MKTRNFTIVYIADVSPLHNREIYEGLRALVPEYRRTKADNMRNEKGRAQILGAGLLLHGGCLELASCCHCDCADKIRNADQHVTVGKHGKPDFDQDMLRAKGICELHFSLSHSGNRVMCGISDAPIGCDVEMMKKRDMKIARRFFHENEYGDIAGQPDEDAKTDRFFRYWTLKESVVKCDGRGLNMPLNGFQIVLGEDGVRIEAGNTGGRAANDVGAGGRAANDVGIWADDDYTLAEFDLNDGYRYSCCVRKSGAIIHAKLIDICGLK